MRPYPAPTGPHAMTMTWSRLLFAHWPVAPDAIQALLPPGLEVETYEGHAYLALVPFRMSNVRAAGLPRVPGTDQFLEMNLRTYAHHPASGKSGVWFFSLDSDSALSNWIARTGFHLRYLLSEMTLTEQAFETTYASRRIQRQGPYHPYPATHAPAVEAVLRYRPTGAIQAHDPKVEIFTNRYRLFSYSSKGRLYAAEIDHAPWPLQTAEVEFEKLDITQGLGVEITGEPHVLYSESIDVRAWRPYRLTS